MPMSHGWIPVHTCNGTTIRAVRQGADADEENDAALTQPLQAADVGFAVLPDGLVGPTMTSLLPRASWI